MTTWVYKIFRAGSKARPIPAYYWHGRGQNGYKRGLWLEAETPIGDANLGAGFHAYTTKAAAQAKNNKLKSFHMGGLVIRVQFKGIYIHNTEDGVVVAKFMRIPKERKCV